MTEHSKHLKTFAIPRKSGQLKGPVEPQGPMRHDGDIHAHTGSKIQEKMA